MAARLTDQQKKQIIAGYVELGSYNAVGVSANTVKSIVQKNAETARECINKKEQNTKDMLAFMDSRKEKAQRAIDCYLDALTDPDRLENATLAQIATAMGIIVDKFTRNTYGAQDSLRKLDGLLSEFKDVVKSETT